MRILLLANNKVGWKITEWLRHQDEQIVGLVLHPEDRRKYGNEIVRASGIPEEAVFDGSRLREADTINRIKSLRADIALSLFFVYILKPEFIDLFPKGVVNIHPSYLPYNRGVNPNVWSIVNGTPAGATLHYIDEGIDTGSLLARREVRVEPIDTGETLYAKLEDACIELFKDSWNPLKDGSLTPIPQDEAEGSAHVRGDIASLDQLKLDESTTVGHLINVLRARTFPPYESAYFEQDGRKIYVRISLRYDEDDSHD